MTSSLLSAALWIAAYLLLVLAPVLVMLMGPAAGAGFWWDFAMAMGFVAMATIGVQFALTARFRRATAPFGMYLISGRKRDRRPALGRGCLRSSVLRGWQAETKVVTNVVCRCRTSTPLAART